MTIWIFALAVIGLTAVTGWNRGAVRASISLVGLLVAALLAMPLGGLVKPVLGFVGIKHPLSQAFFGPMLAFALVMVAFKAGAHKVFTKIDYWLKYRATELQRMMFERMSSRVGLCVGVVNGMIYFVALMVPLHVISHASLQIPRTEESSFVWRAVDTVGAQLRASKMGHVVGGFDPAPESYYVAADIVGLLANNPVLYPNRLRLYPKLLGLFDREEFRQIDSDVDLQRMFLEGAPLAQLLENERVAAVVTNRQIALDLREALPADDLKDLKGFLRTGVSEKHGDERILGQWGVSVQASSAEHMKKNPQITSRDHQAFKNWVAMTLPHGRLVITADNKAVLKLADPSGAPPVVPQPSLRGEWTKADVGYSLKMTSGGPEWRGIVLGDELFVTVGDTGYSVVLRRML
jgi:hypothetical protein